jgi:hypothetical protein
MIVWNLLISLGFGITTWINLICLYPCVYKPVETLEYHIGLPIHKIDNSMSRDGIIVRFPDHAWVTCHTGLTLLQNSPLQDHDIEWRIKFGAADETNVVIHLFHLFYIVYVCKKKKELNMYKKMKWRKSVWNSIERTSEIMGTKWKANKCLSNEQDSQSWFQLIIEETYCVIHFCCNR